MVEDKSFELLTKMYSEMKEQFAVVNGRIDTLQSEVNGRIDTLQVKSMAGLIHCKVKSMAG
jgi:hypothetical protein